MSSSDVNWGMILAVAFSLAVWIGLWFLIGWWSLLVLGGGALALGVLALRD